ncbi:LysR substrate-binding domain-containing protein [Trinickia acidisoli]|uniref:LysR substrate-binding domain-containing protein n=1 Tax=Trinickia acidisoli TaxID=2767482 RepID=UPI001A8D45A1|nr:LysR substrate-binding domain-containing protein [Trinickia acidisoli]
MALPNLDMDALRTLLASQQLGGLHRAAERVGRSQSAVSQQMRKLEGQVGQSLFRRQGKGLALTETGELVLSYARRILDLNDEVVLAIQGAAVAGAVRFGLPGDFAETWLPAALGHFKRTHPGVHVEIAVEKNGVLLERLDRDELDLVLVMGYGSRQDAEPIAKLQMAWIGAPGGDPVLRRDTPLDLALYNQPCFFRRAGIEALESANISWRLAYTTASLQSLWAGVAAGLGVTVRTMSGVPSSLRLLDSNDGLPPLPAVELCLHSSARRMSPALAELKRVVTANAAVNIRC